jgi:hypothetical protein
MYFLRGCAPAFLGVIGLGTNPDSEFLGARAHVDPEVVVVRGGGGAADFEASETLVEWFRRDCTFGVAPPGVPAVARGVRPEVTLDILVTLLVL